MSFSRVPPWDLSRVLSFLSGAPFEPLSSCSLQDLSRKVLFVVALTTARRVGELQALSAVVSESGADLFLSYLPEFRAKAESEARPLPRSFCVRSLTDFVGDLPEELLLCPVRALRFYLSRTASLPSRPRTLFVSPRSPSRLCLRTPLVSFCVVSCGGLLFLGSFYLFSNFFVFSIFFCSLFSPSLFCACSWGPGCRGFVGFS